MKLLIKILFFILAIFSTNISQAIVVVFDNVVSETKPQLGGSITAVSNVGIDLATGNLPEFDKPTDALLYAGGKFLDGLGVAGSGKVAKAGYQGIQKWKWFQQVTIPSDLTLTKIAPATYKMAEITVQSTKKAGKVWTLDHSSRRGLHSQATV